MDLVDDYQAGRLQESEDGFIAHIGQQPRMNDVRRHYQDAAAFQDIEPRRDGYLPVDPTYSNPLLFRGIQCVMPAILLFPSEGLQRISDQDL